MPSRLNPIPDRQLVEGIQAGGRQRRRAECRLYNRYAHFIARAMHQHKLDLEECASAYSDTVVSIVTQLAAGLFAGRCSLKTYVYRVFSRKCIDFLRAKRGARNRVQQTLALDDTFLALPDPARSMVDQLSRQDEVHELRRQLGKLSTKTRTLLLAWGEGYSDEELAQQLGYRSAAVAKTIRLRSLHQLRLLVNGP